MTSESPLPFRQLSFTLTRADMLAYEARPRELAGWRLLLFFLWIGLGGMAVAMLPESLVGEEGGWRFWMFIAASGGIQYAAAKAAMYLFRYWRGIRRLRHPIAVEMLDHIDHLEWREDGVSFFVAPETINRIVEAPAHLFICVGRRVLILPARAFASRHEMTAFAGELEGRGRDD